MVPNTSARPFKPGLQNGKSSLNTFSLATHSKMLMLKDLTEQFATNGCHNINGRAWKRFKSLPPGGCGHITMTVPIWPWVYLHRSRNWPWLHNVSTSGSLAKGEDYPRVSLFEEANDLLIGKSGLFHSRYSPKLADFVPSLWYGREGAGQTSDYFKIFIYYYILIIITLNFFSTTYTHDSAIERR